MQDVPIEVAVPRLARMGYAGLELTVLPGYTTALERLDDAARKRIPVLLREHGLTLTAIAAHSRLLDPPEYRASITRLREAVHLAVALNPGDPPPINTLPGGAPDEWDAVRHRVVDEYARLGEIRRAARRVAGDRAARGRGSQHTAQALWLIEPGRIAQRGSQPRLQSLSGHWHERGRRRAPTGAATRCTRISRASRDVGPDHVFVTPGEDDFDHATYLRAMHDAGYRGFETVEISKMVVGRPGYEPFAHAQLAYDTLADAATRAGIA